MKEVEGRVGDTTWHVVKMSACVTVINVPFSCSPRLGAYLACAALFEVPLPTPRETDFISHR